MKGRTIRIYLVDGVPTGILTAEIINWTGKVIVAPRSQLAELAKREEARRTGVYCLVGQEPDYYVFAEDVGFSSPSAGGAVVNAGNINGRKAWKVEETSQTYQEWYDQKLKAAGVDEEESQKSGGTAD